MKTKKMNEEKMDRKKLTDKELEKVTGGNGEMDIGKVPPIEGLSSLSMSDMVANQEKHGIDNLGGAVAIPGGASQLIN